MPLFGSRGAASVTGFGGLAKLGYLLRNSLRFRASNSAYLNRTFAGVGNQKTWTWSAWVKRGTISSASSQNLFGVIDLSVTNRQNYLTLQTNDTLAFYNYTTSGYNYQLITTQVFRDPSAWYHIVCVSDTTQATSSNRLKLYVNGTEITAFSTASYPSQNFDGWINGNTSSSVQLGIGRVVPYNTSEYLDGYLAEVHFIDGGTPPLPSAFAKTDPATGQWIPIKYGSTYGTNGFYLPFTNTTSTSTLGNDFSGNGNTWTVNNISLTAGATYDSMTDVPTLTSTTAANYVVMNPLDNTLGGSMPTFFAGNLSISFGNAGHNCKATFGFSGTGKYYFEVSGTNSGGIINTISFPGVVNDSGSTWGIQIYDGNINSSTGASAYDGTAYGSGAWPVTGFAFDLASGKLWVRNNSGFYGSGDPATGANPAYSNLSGTITPFWSGGGGGYSGEAYFNFGQRPFAYTAPSGFLPLNTYNL